VQAAEIRIEKKTGKIFVDKFTSVFDVGQVINPKQIRGSVMGGVLMSIGAALYEKVDYDENGKITNPHFFKYHLPTYKEAPEMDVEFVETPDASSVQLRPSSTPSTMPPEWISSKSRSLLKS
jgi:CO/xanthine dehydrogenase Mo-binding subunit